MGEWAQNITGLDMVAPDQLLANPLNARRHPGSQRDALRASLNELGWIAPVIVNETTGHLVDGHARVEEALRAGVESVPVVTVRISENQERLALATYDPITAMATYDTGTLDMLLREVSTGEAALQSLLSDLAEDFHVTGLDGDENADRDPDTAAQDGPTRCQPGDLWIIGGVHRLVIGDCTDPSAVDIVMQGETAQALIYDPPWDSAVHCDALPTVIAFTDGRRLGDTVRMFGAPTWAFTWDCVSSWFTQNRPLQRAKYALWYGDINEYNFDGAHYGDSGRAHYIANQRGRHLFEPDPRGKHLSDVFSQPITAMHGDGDHPHEKPLDWVRMLIGNCTESGALLYDPCMGSGTTLIAAHRTGRRCYGCEIDPRYGDVILRRAEAEGLSVELAARA